MEKLNFVINGQELPQQACDVHALDLINVEYYNRQPGDLTGYDCPKCQNRGRFACIDPTNHLSFYSCSCMKIRKSIAALESSGLSALVKRMRFDTFLCESPWQHAMLQKARDYAGSPQGWFLACGQPGSGKTHLCTAICRELLLQGRQLQYIPWRELVEQVTQNRGDTLEKLKTVEVLYIDDLFKAVGNVPDWMTALAFQIFNARYIADKITIVSTELSPQALVDVDEAVGSRLLEKAGQNILMVDKDKQKNYRLRAVCNL